MVVVDWANDIDALIKGEQYAHTQAQKEAALVPIFRKLIDYMGERCPEYGRFIDRLGQPELHRLADIRPVPVAMFKHFALRAVPQADVVRELNSSGTTGQARSRIFIDKSTAFRQSRALASILKSHIGSQRRPYLVLDAPESAAAGDRLVARGAAIRGVGAFASSTTYAMRLRDSGDLELDLNAVESFFERHGDEPVLLFGFSYIVWDRFVEVLRQRNLAFRAPHGLLLHSGGWKKLQSRAVAKDVFNREAAQCLGCAESSILDFYGMVEQVGTVFIDCESGNKHAPAFADVVLRRGSDLEPVDIGEEGVIEVLSVLPTSYPGHALLTEDRGMLVGVDDCACGRGGQYFRFTQRIERSEARGCGDIFAQEQSRR